MRRGSWLVAMVIVFAISLMQARTALAFEEPTVTIDRPSPDETHAVKVTVPNIDSSGNGRYPFSCTVEGSGVTQTTWDVSPSTRGGWPAGNTGTDVTYQAIEKGYATITVTVDYVCEHGNSGQVTAQVTIRQYRVELLDDDGNALTAPPQPQQTNYGNSAPFQVYISQRYSIAGPSYSPPVTLRFADYPVGTGGLGGDLTYVASEQRSADGTYVIGDSGTNRVFGYGLSSAKNDVELDIRIARAGDGSSWGIGHFHRFTVCKIVGASVLAYSGNDALDDNPVANGDGLRIYPGKQTPSESDSMHRDYVTARVDITPLVPDQVVWFRKFDPDDPTANGVNNVLDPADTAAARNGADNFPWDASNNSTDPAKWITGNPPPAGTPNAAEWRSKETDATGRVDLDFQVGLNAGNNYILTGSLEYQYLADSRVRTSDGLSVEHTPDFALLPTASPSPNPHAAASEPLFVWRRLHIELDRMEEKTETQFESACAEDVWVSEVVPLDDSVTPSIPTSWTGRVGSQGIQGSDASPNRDSASPGEGRWERGDLEVADSTTIKLLAGNGDDQAELTEDKNLYCILEKSGNTPIYVWCELWQPDASITTVRLTTKLTTNYVDWSFKINGTNYGGVIAVQGTDDGKTTFDLDEEEEFLATFWEDDSEALATTPRSISTLKFQESDDHDENVFAKSFIMPVVDGGGSLSNNDDDVSTELYVDPSDWPDQIDDNLGWDGGWDSVDDRQDRFWIAYAQAVYQGPRAPMEGYKGDNDSASEGMLAGIGYLTAAAGGGALVFSESLHDWGRTKSWTATEHDTAFSYVAAHEIGHEFGAQHKGEVKVSIMRIPFFSDPDGDYEFEEVTRLQFRRYVASPGSRPAEPE